MKSENRGEYMLTKIRTDYTHTIYACYLGYISQAVTNNFAPLLFLTFRNTWGLTLSQITMLSVANFGTQLLIDLLSAVSADKIGYRASMVIAHTFSTAGLLGMAFLPYILPNAFAGLMLSAIFYGIGGGLVEVLISPIVEACPTKKKEAAMSLLHSFYCWGFMAAILLSTLFFKVCGIENWRVLACLWAIIPLFNTFYFSQVPIQPIVPKEKQTSAVNLLLQPKFWILIIIMVCSGASSQAMQQWVSAFAESGLGVSKTVGDLIGPCGFAFFMGLVRVLYSKYSDHISLKSVLLGSSILCTICYIAVGLTNNSVFGLLACAVCGFSIGMFWPGTFSIAAKAMPLGGTAMFAFMALAGDVGCSFGPSLVGLVADLNSADLQSGLFSSVIFPVLIFFCVLTLTRKEKAQ